MIKFFSGFVLLTASLAAAGPSGVVPGYVLDGRNGSIRAIYGIPGALQLSPPLDLPFRASSAAFGPAGDYALAISTEQPAHAYLVQALSSTPTVTDLGPIADGTRVLASNGAGSAALLYSGDAIQFVTGLPGTASLSAPIATAALAGPITAAALDAKGACAIVGTGALETLCADGTSQRLIPDGLNISDLLLINKERDLIFADRAAHQIVLVKDYAQSAATTTLAGTVDGVDTPVGLQAISASRVLAADSGACAVFAIDPSGLAPVTKIDVSITPTQLRSLNDPSILLLNDPSAMPFTIIDVPSMTAFFIPTANPIQ